MWIRIFNKVKLLSESMILKMTDSVIIWNYYERNCLKSNSYKKCRF